MSKYGGDYDPGYESYIDGLHADIQEVMDERDRLGGKADELGRLCHDVLAVLIGWSWKLNELAGYTSWDEDTYPSRVVRDFLDRARELGVPL